ncbi:MAG: ABC-type cobalamin/Fe3+-siderophore transport system, ATPase component [Synergistales bacterium 54_24]|nr:MAG: ABC-type cobalamin/Fe3+-siderophore transport system, ATPase component [Synergistales bacterium 54_24]
MLEVRNLSVSYGKKKAVKSATFGAAAGKLIALLGPNGSGKSTILKALAGLLPTERGSVHICGKPIEGYSRKALAKAVALLPQGSGFYAPFTVLEAVAMGRFPHSSSLFGPLSEDDIGLSRDLLAKLELGGFEDRPVTTLSGGEAQRVAIAQTLAQDTPIFLLDEPTSALDPRHAILVMELLRSLTLEGRSLLVILHDVNLSLRFADELLFLKEGELMAACVPEEVNPELLEAVYDVPWAVEESPKMGRVAFPVSEPARRESSAFPLLRAQRLS